MNQFSIVCPMDNNYLALKKGFNMLNSCNFKVIISGLILYDNWDSVDFKTIDQLIKKKNLPSIGGPQN